MRIAVAGFGIEGRANFNYWTDLGYEVDILDESEAVADIPHGATAILGDEAYFNLDEYKFVVRTAGLPPRKLESARKIWSATNEFFKKCPAPIVGVTGSKGKGTTSSLIESILRADGRRVHLVGNIGVPALDILPDISADDVVVYEMSSFQLWDIQASPKVAVVLHMEPDHLDVHASLDEYIEAKSNIVRFQKDDDVTVFHPHNHVSFRIASQRKGDHRKSLIRYGLKGQNTDLPYSYADDEKFYFSQGPDHDIAICSVDKLQIPGRHNIDNANAAITSVLQLGVGIESIPAGLEGFKGLDHRLKIVADIKGVKYYDDSIATTPGSSMAAVQAFDSPKVLILGGSSKGADFTQLAQVISSAKIRHIILIGSEAQKLRQACLDAGVPDEVMSLLAEGSMKDVVQKSSEHALVGDVVLLTPACASFGQFKNYQDRGDQFIDAVNDLKSEV